MTRKIGNYTLVTHLAQGGMADIFLAQIDGPEGFKKELVVKRILPQLALEPAFVEMFVNEAKLAATLTHPNIVQVHELGQADDTWFIAMEYVRGLDLSRVHKRLRAHGTPLSASAIVAIGVRVLRALHHAHASTDPAGKPLGLVHRDVSPQNVLLSFDGLVKLTDFGIAKATTSAQKTQTGTLKGKVSYMAPEQAEGEPLDARTDLFAVGLVLYELLCGRRPYNAVGDFALLAQARRAQFPPIEKVTPVPAALAAVIGRLLQKDPAARYQSALEALRELQAAHPAADEEELAELVRQASHLPPVDDEAKAASDEVRTARLSEEVIEAPVKKPPYAWLAVAAIAAIFAFVSFGPKEKPEPEPPIITAVASAPVAAKEAPASEPIEAPAKPAPEKTGYLTLNAEPWAKVTIDGEGRTLTTPIKRLPLSAGKHRVKLFSPGPNKRQDLVVVIEPDKTTVRIVEMAQ